MKRSWKLALAIIIVGLLLGGVRLLALGPADFPDGQVVFEPYKIEPGVVLPGEVCKYRFFWKGSLLTQDVFIPAAEGVVKVEKHPTRPGWQCHRADGVTIPPASLIFKADDGVFECMDAATWKADQYSIRIRESFDYYDLSMTFDQEKKTLDRVRTRRKGETRRTFDFTQGYGPVGAVALSRSMAWEVGDERKFEVMDGNERWLIVLKCEAEEDVTVPAGTFHALRFQPSLFLMPKNPSFETKRYWEKEREREATTDSRIKTAKIWSQKEPPRVLLKFQSEVFFGHVYGELVEYTPGTAE